MSDWSNTKTLRIVVEMTIAGDADRSTVAGLLFDWLCADGDEDMPGEVLSFDDCEVIR